MSRTGSTGRTRSTGRTLTVIVVVAVALAGCTGFGPSMPDAGGNAGGDGNNAGGDGNGDGGSGGDGDGGSGGDGGTGSGDADESFQPFRFDQPATYTFDVMDAREGNGRLVWDVQSIDGENVTLRSVFEFQGETQESTMTVSREDAMLELAFSPGGQYAVQTMFSSTMSQVYGEDLRVGRSWTFPSQDGTMTYEVTEKRKYAGVECYYSEIRVDGAVVRAGCYSPDHGVAPYSAHFDENGNPVLEVKLAGYERN